jgi:hypothetical protein
MDIISSSKNETGPSGLVFFVPLNTRGTAQSKSKIMGHSPTMRRGQSLLMIDGHRINR